MTPLASQIEQQLAVLQGLPLWASHRAADLQSFQFGSRHIVQKRSGGTATVGDFALHIQCAWRISGPAGIVVASRDRYDPPDGIEHTEEFDWDTQGGNRSDVRMAAFLAGHDGLRVLTARADASGGFILSLEQGFALEAFPDGSDASEHWRLFRPDTDASHIMMTGRALEGTA